MTDTTHNPIESAKSAGHEPALLLSPTNEPTRASSARRYAEMGVALVPIKAGTKAAYLPNWTKATITNPDEAERWWLDNPTDNIGAQLEASGLAVLDMDDLEATRAALSALGIGLAEMLKAGARLEGNPERAKVVFQAPKGHALSRRVLHWPTREGGANAVVFELRAGPVQDLLPPSVHPSGKPYCWLTPIECREDIPELPEPLLRLWLEFDAHREQLENACPWRPESNAPEGIAAAAREFLERDREADAWDAVRDEILLRLPLESVLEEMGVKLRNYRAPCPFHQPDQSPSFWVWDTGNGFKLWCDAHGDAPVGVTTRHGWSVGDALNLYAFHHGLSMGKATAHLARDLDIQLPSSEGLEAPKKPPGMPSGFGALSATSLWKMEFPEARWAIPGLLPEGLTMLASPPKSGKSHLCLSLAVAVALGQHAMGKVRVEMGDVLYLGLEDNLRRLRQRLQQMTVAPPECLYLDTSLPRLDKGGLDTLRGWVELHPNTRLVVLDTLARVRPPSKGGSNPYQEDATLTAMLQEFALEKGFALVVVTHTRKMEANDAFSMVSGTQGMTASADAIWVLERVRGQNRATLHVTGRDIEERELALERDQATGHWVLVGEDAATNWMSPERREILETIRHHGPLGPRRIAELLGKSESTVKNLLVKMRDADQVNVEGGKYSPIMATTP